jgi:hypothetical protein
MIKLMLNTRKPYNYAFFCPESRLHLTVGNPVGFADRVTSAILRGLRSNAIIDVENAIDVKAGKLKTGQTEEKSKEKQVASPKAETAPPIESEPEKPVEPEVEEQEAPATPVEDSLPTDLPVDAPAEEAAPVQEKKTTAKGGRGKKTK